MKKPDNPEQLWLPLDQQQWKSAKELAAVFGLNEESAYRWRRELIPEVHPKTKQTLIHYAGTRRILFHVDCVKFLEDKFAAAHE